MPIGANLLHAGRARGPSMALRDECYNEALVDPLGANTQRELQGDRLRVVGVLEGRAEALEGLSQSHRRSSVWYHPNRKNGKFMYDNQTVLH